MKTQKAMKSYLKIQQMTRLKFDDTSKTMES